MLVGCGNQQETNNPGTEQPTTSESTSTNEPTSAPTATPDATEELTATEEPTQPPHEHTYTESTSKEATCTEAGEKTFTCDLTDTRTAEGSKLEYTYTEMNATMYATQTVNVRNLPSTDGEKIGSLSTNQEITVIGQCNETVCISLN